MRRFLYQIKGKTKVNFVSVPNSVKPSFKMAATQEPDVNEMFDLLPTPGGNNSGKPARKALVSKLKASTPGRHTEAFGKGDTFRKIFFPNCKSAPYEGNTSIIGLDNKWWSDFSTAVLCQAMYNLTSDLRKQLKKDNINNAVKGKNSDLKKHCMAFYAKVFSETYIKTPYNSIQSKKSAKAEYISALTSDAWITAKRAVASEGMWTDAAWELYHHWVKLHLLGASNGEIDGIIKQLSDKKLMIPPEVGAGKWTSYTAWMNPTAITWQDIQGDAAKGILKSETMPSYGPYGRPSSMKEENSFEFTANGQPGKGYRNTGGSGGHGGSCFTGDTKVLMANGSLLPIRSVEVGDEVFTLQGPRRVAVISMPTRKKRHLYSLNGFSFRFTETHPFVTPAGLSGGGMDSAAHAFTAVSPRKLANLVPTLSRLGIVKMEEGSIIMSLQDKQPHPTAVYLVEEHPLQKPESEEDLLYDLILEPTKDGFPNYVVGDDSILVLVASEVPRIEVAPFAAITILKALQEAADQIERQPLPVNRGEPPSRVPHVFHVFSPTKALVSNVDALTTILKTKQAESCDVSDMLSVFVKEDTASEQTSYRRELGDAYDQIAAVHGEEIDAVVDLGSRSMGQEEDDKNPLLLSVSLLDIIFHDLPKHSPGKRLAVNIEARTAEDKTDKAWCEESNDKISSHFARHFRQVFYFENVDKDDEGLIDLRFQVHDTEKSQPLPYTARVIVPCEFEHNYRMFEAILLEEGDQEIGLLRFDVRFLSTNAKQEEQRRSETWKDADKQAYALALGKCYGEYLTKELPNLRGHGLVPVAKRSWFKCSCFNA
ncbi:Hypp489 [Branchiostoma lanceolatum]|uniref:Hypp489 protein n=1 Tax=Branchiostoma lanceolatum TaxID=7740 RepID=A0A8J9VZV9_BRALA|nr:Hypp489 [Branchiostoma lanceolatum]